ncbi:MAG: hypothetical protein K2I53_13545, partial [Lachnospiraceae bacterium]|nr:hypothetical protein [Lachnospiraceae bacterium]
MEENQKKEIRQKNNMTEMSQNPLRKTGPGGFRVNIHLILLAAFVLIIGLSAFGLYKWNKGSP